VATHSTTASVGRPAPDFSLADADGQTVHLADERAHGAVVVVFLRGFA
jgi:peroxiredoxin